MNSNGEDLLSLKSNNQNEFLVKCESYDSINEVKMEFEDHVFGSDSDGGNPCYIADFKNETNLQNLFPEQPKFEIFPNNNDEDAERSHEEYKSSLAYEDEGMQPFHLVERPCDSNILPMTSSE